MNRADVEAIVKTILSGRLGIAPVDIKNDSRIRDLGADSLDAVELVMSFEEAFRLDIIEDEDAEKMDTLQKVVDYIEKHLPDEKKN